MKGITHFSVGVAVAACFPDAVAAGMQGESLYFVLGGVCGLLPDTLDFKVVRFLAKRDMEVQPDPLCPDPDMIARAIATAIERAQRGQQAVRIKLNTIRMAADAWQSYEVTLDSAKRRVCVRLGPIVNTGGQPVRTCEVDDTAREGAAELPCDIRIEYSAVTRVDILEGPTFEMTPSSGDRVAVGFIPWHRRWTHSAAAAVTAGCLGWALKDATAGGIMGLALGAHVLVDQCGFMGSCLWWPFRKLRVPGWGRVRSGDSMANLVVVWSACLVIFWNLYVQTMGPLMPLNPIKLAGWGLAVPWAAIWLVRRCLRKRRRAA